MPYYGMVKSCRHGSFRSRDTEGPLFCIFHNRLRRDGRWLLLVVAGCCLLCLLCLFCSLFSSSQSEVSHSSAMNVAKGRRIVRSRCGYRPTATDQSRPSLPPTCMCPFAPKAILWPSLLYEAINLVFIVIKSISIKYHHIRQVGIYGP